MDTPDRLAARSDDAVRGMDIAIAEEAEVVRFDVTGRTRPPTAADADIAEAAIDAAQTKRFYTRARGR